MDTNADKPAIAGKAGQNKAIPCQFRAGEIEIVEVREQEASRLLKASRKLANRLPKAAKYKWQTLTFDCVDSIRLIIAFWQFM